MGGCQGSPLPNSSDSRSSFFGFEYAPGSFADRINESFAGPHDWLRDSFGAYDEEGNAKFLVGTEARIDQIVNYGLVLPATPFGVAAVAPGYLSGSVQMMIRRPW